MCFGGATVFWLLYMYIYREVFYTYIIVFWRMLGLVDTLHGMIACSKQGDLYSITQPYTAYIITNIPININYHIIGVICVKV